MTYRRICYWFEIYESEDSLQIFDALLEASRANGEKGFYISEYLNKHFYAPIENLAEPFFGVPPELDSEIDALFLSYLA